MLLVVKATQVDLQTRIVTNLSSKTNDRYRAPTAPLDMLLNQTQRLACCATQTFLHTQQKSGNSPMKLQSIIQVTSSLFGGELEAVGTLGCCRLLRNFMIRCNSIQQDWDVPAFQSPICGLRSVSSCNGVLLHGTWMLTGCLPYCNVFLLFHLVLACKLP